MLHSFVLQGASIVQQQKYIELFLVADNRAVRYTHGTFLWKSERSEIKQKIKDTESHPVILVKVNVSSWVMWAIFKESTAV